MPPKHVRAELVAAPFFSSTSKKDGPSTSSRRTEEGIALSLILAPPQSLRPDRGGRRQARGRESRLRSRRRNVHGAPGSCRLRPRRRSPHLETTPHKDSG